MLSGLEQLKKNQQSLINTSLSDCQVRNPLWFMTAPFPQAA
jgi:hypothetical protein